MTFAHPDGDEFRGFLWQARLCADDSFVSSGGFVEDTLPADAQLHDCSVPEVTLQLDSAYDVLSCA